MSMHEPPIRYCACPPGALPVPTRVNPRLICCNDPRHPRYTGKTAGGVHRRHLDRAQREAGRDVAEEDEGSAA